LAKLLVGADGLYRGEIFFLPLGSGSCLREAFAVPKAFSPELEPTGTEAPAEIAIPVMGLAAWQKGPLRSSPSFESAHPASDTRAKGSGGPTVSDRFAFTPALVRFPPADPGHSQSLTTG
jgi:hypothetical protein